MYLRGITGVDVSNPLALQVIHETVAVEEGTALLLSDTEPRPDFETVVHKFFRNHFSLVMNPAQEGDKVGWIPDLVRSDPKDRFEDVLPGLCVAHPFATIVFCGFIKRVVVNRFKQADDGVTEERDYVVDSYGHTGTVPEQVEGNRSPLVVREPDNQFHWIVSPAFQAFAVF